jgi:hypothetical protein
MCRGKKRRIKGISKKKKKKKKETTWKTLAWIVG